MTFHPKPFVIPLMAEDGVQGWISGFSAQTSPLHFPPVSAISRLPIGTRLVAERKDCANSQGLDPVFPCLRSFV